MTTIALPDRFDSGDLSFQVLHRPNRRTLEITVERDASLSLKVPDGVTSEQIQDFIAQKRSWIYRKLAEKDALARPPVVKQFIDGEGFAYLGRTYRLLLVESEDVAVKLAGGRLRVRRSDAVPGSPAIRRWYESTGATWIHRRIKPWLQRTGAGNVGVRVSSLGCRWGSAGLDGVNVHWATLQLAPTLIDYVLVHELVHLHEANHSPRFWQLVARAIPDYEARRETLARKGSELWLGDVASREEARR